MIEGPLDTLLDRRRLGQFISVGIVGSAVDLSISMSLVLTTPTHPVVAKFFGAECAIVVMFVVNDRWTFGDVETHSWMHALRRLAKSNLVRGGGLVVQLVAVYLLTRLPVTVFVNGTDLWPALTMPIAIACGFLVNYTGETLLTWRVDR